MGWWLAAAYWACWPMRDGWVLPKLTVISVGLLVCAWRAERVMVPRRALWWLMAVAMAAAWSRQPLLATLGVYGEWSHGVMAAALCVMIMGLQPRGWRWLKWLGAGLAAHAILQHAGLDPLRALDWNRRAICWDGSPLDVGLGIAMALPWVTPWAWPLFGVGLWATGSKGAMLAAAGALCGGRSYWRLLPLLVLAGAATFSQRPVDRARREVQRRAAVSFLHHPVLGTGPSTFKSTGEGDMSQHHAHNALLEAGATTGLVGLIALLWLLWPALNHPSIWALLIYSMVDPFNIETYAVAALIAGNVRSYERVDCRRWAIALGFFSAVFCAAGWRVNLQ